MKPDALLYWADPIDQLDSLRVAVKYLLKPSMGPRERFDAATLPLVKYKAADFPESQRSRFERIMGNRVAVRRDYGGNALFEFNELTARQRQSLRDDLIALYESCLLDIGRMSTTSDLGHEYYEVVYPNDA